MENKSRIGRLALCFFAAIPGAGHMYLGLMKTGAVHMVLFVGAFALGNILYFDLFYYAMIILWFYSFFDVYRLERLKKSGNEVAEDEIAFLKTNKNEYTSFLNKHGKTVGIVCVAVGVVYLLRDVLLPYLHQYELSEKVLQIIQDISSTLPQVVGGLLIIVLGIWLIKGKSRELKRQEQGSQKEE